MSAPKTRDPLAVTTRDGMTWARRAITQDGRGLYAPEGVCNCPEFVMASLAELAEHGIKGRDPVADAVAAMGALPVPVGPDTPAADYVRSAITAAIGEAKPARDGLLVSLAQSVKDRAEHDHDAAADWDWYCLNLSGYMGDRMGSVLRRLVDAETERDALRARVAELEAAAAAARIEFGVRPTADALDVRLQSTNREFVEEQLARLRGSYPDARLVQFDTRHGAWTDVPVPAAASPEALHAASGAVIETTPQPEDVSRQVSDLRGLLARQRAAVEEPHDDPVGLHHDYRTPRDLPEAQR